MKQNHEKLQSELLQMRQFMQKYAPNESFPQDINGTSNEQVPDHNSGQERVPQSSRISSNAEITLPQGLCRLYIVLPVPGLCNLYIVMYIVLPVPGLCNLFLLWIYPTFSIFPCNLVDSFLFQATEVIQVCIFFRTDNQNKCAPLFSVHPRIVGNYHRGRSSFYRASLWSLQPVHCDVNCVVHCVTSTRSLQPVHCAASTRLDNLKFASSIRG